MLPDERTKYNFSKDKLAHPVRMQQVSHDIMT